MASSAATITPEVLRRPNLLIICAKEAKYEFLKNLRFPMFSVSTLVFPLMFYVLFGLVMGRQTIGSISTTVYLIPAYGTFGVMGASLFGTAAGLSSERGLGWLQVKRASPMPLFAYFSAKVLMAITFSTIDVVALMLMGFVFGGVHLTGMTAVKLLFTLVAGSIPFCAMGLAIGYFASPNSAPAVINLFLSPDVVLLRPVDAVHVSPQVRAENRSVSAAVSPVTIGFESGGRRTGRTGLRALGDAGRVYTALPGRGTDGASTRSESEWMRAMSVRLRMDSDS